MNQSITVYEVGCEIQQAYRLRRDEARALPTLVEQRSALLAAVDQYRTSLMLIGYTIPEFDADGREVAHA